SVDPRRLAPALTAALREAGGELRTGTEVVDGLWDGERLVGIRTAPVAGGVVELCNPVGDKALPVEVHADAVVLCNGAWAAQTPWLPPQARPPVRAVKGEGIELRPRDDRPLVAGPNM